VPYAEALREHVDDLRRAVERKAKAAEPSAGKAPFAFEGLGDLVAAVRKFEAAASEADRAAAALAERDDVTDAQFARVNDALTRVERALLLSAGLPGRPWFKHAVYAPGLTTGYASWPLPGVRQAILDGDSTLLKAQVAALVERLDAAAEALRLVTKEGAPAGGGRQPAP
jgi:N-acetylated-alpha-linked acidic dipeptidase